MKKKICPRCGSIIDFNTKCSCAPVFSNSIKKHQKESDNKLRTRKWARLRESILKRDKYLCQRCFIKYGIVNTEDLTIHHIKSRHKHPELFYERNNLITICRVCNSQLEAMHLDHQLDFTPTTLDNENEFNL